MGKSNPEPDPDIRSGCLYGQFSLDKTLTLQAGATVLMIMKLLPRRERMLLSSCQKVYVNLFAILVGSHPVL